MLLSTRQRLFDIAQEAERSSYLARISER